MFRFTGLDVMDTVAARKPLRVALQQANWQRPGTRLREVALNIPVYLIIARCRLHRERVAYFAPDAARAKLEGERLWMDQVDCCACMWAGFPMREHPEVKDAHWDEERKAFRFLNFSRAEHKRLGVEHYLEKCSLKISARRK